MNKQNLVKSTHSNSCHQCGIESGEVKQALVFKHNHLRFCAECGFVTFYNDLIKEKQEAIRKIFKKSSKMIASLQIKHDKEIEDLRLQIKKLKNG